MANYYRQVLVDTIRKYVGDNPKIGAEIGVHTGWTSWHLLSTFPDLRLLMVDPWTPYSEHLQDSHRLARIREQKEWDSIKKQAEDRVWEFQPRAVFAYKTSQRAAPSFADKTFDFVFIDALHDYESVKQDIQLWLPKCKTLICGHDYRSKSDLQGKFGVTKAVNEIFGKHDILRPGCSIWAYLLTQDS